MTSRLSSDQIQQLSPLLGSLARLIARGTTVDDRQLQLLLIAADLEAEEDALQELRRWARLLRSVRESPDEAVRQTVVEGLGLRGLPEAAVILAVSTVADAARAESSPATPPTPGLHASVARLDFGTLPAGESATLMLDVEGGPGHVIVDSDQVTVDPMAFEAGHVQLSVEVRPYGGDLLWTTLKLVGESGTLDLPVVAQWQDLIVSSPPSTVGTNVAHDVGLTPRVWPPPSAETSVRSDAGLTPRLQPPGTLPPVEIVVAVDGSGAYRTLEDALAAAGPGAIIRLRNGQHLLSRGCELRPPIALVGESMDFTEVIAERGDYVLRSDGLGTLTLRDLCLRWAGPTVADVLSVQNSELDIEHCRFVGATVSGDESGAGVLMEGSASGRVAACEFAENGYGILADEQAQSVLEDNDCSNNWDSGIAYFGSSGGIARRNRCSDNQLDGISIGEMAAPTIEGNICRSNGENGISYDGESTGTAAKNECEGNEENGIAVSEQAQPALEGNTCRGNKDSGISYSGHAAGAARANICTGNECHGIGVNDQAKALLEDNHCLSNKLDGIAFFDQAAGIVRRNECADNANDGISLNAAAQPELQSNTCRANGSSGISYVGESGGAARRNICAENTDYGIYVDDQAQPMLEANDCRQNGRVGIALFGQAGGWVARNSCAKNEICGILVAARARPQLANNDCRDNGEADVRDGRR